MMHSISTIKCVEMSHSLLKIKKACNIIVKAVLLPQQPGRSFYIADQSIETLIKGELPHSKSLPDGVTCLKLLVSLLSSSPCRYIYVFEHP